jgi:uroporphyrinogen-III decarboxylase
MTIARAILSDNAEIGLQGNLDPEVLRNRPLNEIRKKTIAILDALKGRHRSILNLGHGILPDKPEAHAECYIHVQSHKTP